MSMDTALQATSDLSQEEQQEDDQPVGEAQNSNAEADADGDTHAMNIDDHDHSDDKTVRRTTWQKWLRRKLKSWIQSDKKGLKFRKVYGQMLKKFGKSLDNQDKKQQIKEYIQQIVPKLQDRLAQEEEEGGHQRRRSKHRRERSPAGQRVSPSTQPKIASRTPAANTAAGPVDVRLQRVTSRPASNKEEGTTKAKKRKQASSSEEEPTTSSRPASVYAHPKRVKTLPSQHRDHVAVEDDSEPPPEDDVSPRSPSLHGGLQIIAKPKKKNAKIEYAYSDALKDLNSRGDDESWAATKRRGMVKVPLSFPVHFFMGYYAQDNDTQAKLESSRNSRGKKDLPRNYLLLDPDRTKNISDEKIRLLLNTVLCGSTTALRSKASIKLQEIALTMTITDITFQGQDKKNAPVLPVVHFFVGRKALTVRGPDKTFPTPDKVLPNVYFFMYDIAKKRFPDLEAPRKKPSLEWLKRLFITRVPDENGRLRVITLADWLPLFVEIGGRVKLYRIVRDTTITDADSADEEHNMVTVVQAPSVPPRSPVRSSSTQSQVLSAPTTTAAATSIMEDAQDRSSNDDEEGSDGEDNNNNKSDEQQAEDQEAGSNSSSSNNTSTSSSSSASDSENQDGQGSDKDSSRDQQQQQTPGDSSVLQAVQPSPSRAMASGLTTLHRDLPPSPSPRPMG